MIDCDAFEEGYDFTGMAWTKRIILMTRRRRR